METKTIKVIMDIEYDKMQDESDIRLIGKKLKALFKMSGPMNALSTRGSSPVNMNITDFSNIQHEFLYREIENVHEALTHPDYGRFQKAEPFTDHDYKAMIQVIMNDEDLWNDFDGRLHEIVESELQKREEKEEEQ